jgi:hypothetical protein
VKKSPSNNSIFEQKTILTFVTDEWDTVPWWTFKLNSVPAAAEKLHLEGHMLKVKNKSSYFIFPATHYWIKESNAIHKYLLHSSSNLKFTTLYLVQSVIAWQWLISHTIEVLIFCDCLSLTFMSA